MGGAAERHYAGRKAGIARGSRLPHPFLWQEEGKIPGVPEEPEPGANDACLNLPLFDIMNLAIKVCSICTRSAGVSPALLQMRAGRARSGSQMREDVRAPCERA